MSRISLAVVAVASLGLGLGFSQARADEPVGPLKVVVHVNFPESDRQGRGLKNIANILREVGDSGATIEVVCHGEGIGLIKKTGTEHAPQVAELIKKGVRFVACENTMRQKSIRKDDLLSDTGTVPSGALEVIRKQRDGFAYFKP